MNQCNLFDWNSIQRDKVIRSIGWGGGGGGGGGLASFPTPLFLVFRLVIILNTLATVFRLLF